MREIEEVVDAQMNQLRAQLIQELVHMGEVGEWSEEPPEARPRCERCGTVLVSHGKQTRWLQTNGGEAVKLERRYGTCPQCGYGIFPLDEQLGLDGAGLTPRGQEALVRLAAWMSFEQAGQLLGDLLGIGVSATSTRRYTYQAGQTALELQHAEEERIRAALPEPPKGAKRQVISADGAFVPLIGGEWAEVKTMVVGEVVQNEEGEASTTQVSSFSRLVDVETISQQAVVELHRRGVERADAVCAVTDGAEWRHRFVDDHCPTAVRILDFGHAAGYVNAIGQAAAEAGDALVPKWLEQQLHDLKHEGPEQVLTELRRLHAHHPTVRLLGEKLAYLEKWEAHMQYPTYHEAGWPIGSGIVESANKRVCALPGTIASVESYLWREKSVNGSVFLGSVAIKVCRFCDFGSIPLPRKPEAASHKTCLFCMLYLYLRPTFCGNAVNLCGEVQQSWLDASKQTSRKRENGGMEARTVGNIWVYTLPPPCFQE